MVKKATFTNGNILITAKQKLISRIANVQSQQFKKENHIFCLMAKKALFLRHDSRVTDS
jgi:hypothetical protein